MHGNEGDPRGVEPGDGAPLLARLARALDAGEVTRDDVLRVLARDRGPVGGGPGAAGVLYALGAVVVLVGLAIAYGTVHDDLPRAVRVVAPFAFPLAAFVACLGLARRRAPWWQVDLAGLVGYVAFAVASGVSGAAWGWTDTARGAAAGVAVTALVGVAIAVLLHRVTGSTRLLWVGVPAALAALGVALAFLAGLWDAPAAGPERLGWVLLGEAVAAAVVAWVLSSRDPAGCRYAAVWATVGGYAAVVFAGDDLASFSVWHVVLAGVVVAAFLAAAALDSDVLVWLAAAGGAFWVVLIAVVVGSATGAALAVVLAGLGLVGLGVLVARRLRATGAR